MRVRRAVVEDAEGVARVQVDTWKSTYKGIVPDEYLEKMTYENRTAKWKTIIPAQYVYVAEGDTGDIIGFSHGGTNHTEQFTSFKGELYAIYILEEFQRQGLGRTLIEPVLKRLTIDGIDSMMVFVLEDNPFRLFYEKLGGEWLGSAKAEMVGRTLQESVYGFRDIHTLLSEITTAPQE
ncbi:GNAT family N-acetyltransferase [Halobacillus litoralis]|uniref:GNAT family N-acetyltransferase n=1 Tax=Halobacillus litoralis TaxID=45668 RepID=UPI001CD7176F|nr:GNAT family N-acetyltransferase [Halobacillus litoralis]MCA0969662.1 GNAT family N-acetyltransferase [Halobacillus litoralis]